MATFSLTYNDGTLPPTTVIKSLSAIESGILVSAVAAALGVSSPSPPQIADFLSRIWADAAVNFAFVYQEKQRTTTPISFT